MRKQVGSLEDIPEEERKRAMNIYIKKNVYIRKNIYCTGCAELRQKNIDPKYPKAVRLSEGGCSIFNRQLETDIEGRFLKCYECYEAMRKHIARGGE
jgi:hypothetical protein